MNRKILLFPFLCLQTIICFAQDNDVKTLREEARTFLQQGEYDNALQLLEKARAQQPDNLDVLKDEVFTYYYKRDYAKALEIGKTIIARDDADAESFQLLGMVYKAVADYKEGDKIYKAALKKFPKSGVLYSEYGDLLQSSDNKSGAIKLWEKGIEVDPNISGNYYYASKYYAKNGNIIWGLLYAELFINIESLTKRTTEIKAQLFNGYKKLFENRNDIAALKTSDSPFGNAVAETFSRLTEVMKNEPAPETITALRTRFILDWYAHNTKKFRFRLFDYQRQLLQDGYFDAYNQWIFGEAASEDKYSIWVYTHDEDMQAFQKLQHTLLFKVPAGQYYEH
ncbi:MAG: tetratricopeptide repeat protein [Parafilimonas sp.]